MVKPLSKRKKEKEKKKRNLRKKNPYLPVITRGLDDDARSLNYQGAFHDIKGKKNEKL